MDEIETLREELRLTQHALMLATQVNLYKTGFLGRISHELRSHLSSLLSLHQLILGDLCEDNAEEREFIGQAYLAGCKLMKVIEDVANVSKLDSGLAPLDLQPLSMTDFLHELYHLIYLPIRNKHLQLNVVFPETDILVLADSKRLLTASVILLETGIDYMKTGALKIQLEPGRENSTAIRISFPFSEPDWFNKTSLPELKSNFDLEDLRKFTQNLSLSPSLKLELVKNILDTMHTSLEVNNVNFNTVIKFLLPPLSPKLSQD